MVVKLVHIPFLRGHDKVLILDGLFVRLERHAPLNHVANGFRNRSACAVLIDLSFQRNRQGYTNLFIFLVLIFNYLINLLFQT